MSVYNNDKGEISNRNIYMHMYHRINANIAYIFKK